MIKMFKMMHPSHSSRPRDRVPYLSMHTSLATSGSRLISEIGCCPQVHKV